MIKLSKICAGTNKSGHILFKRAIVISILLFCLLPSIAIAQSLPVGTIVLEDYYRRQQLAGKVDSSVSMMVRPLFPRFGLNTSNFFTPDSADVNFRGNGDNSKFSSLDGKIKGQLLPVQVNARFNSHHPNGWNDGAMIPAKGIQTVLSAGLFAEYGPFSVQLRPELIIAANDPFEEFTKDHFDIVDAWYYDFYNNVDLPARFGSATYSKLFLGQSSVRVNHRSLSFGLSTENLWWGPGLHNSLLMSNTAPGFAHLTLNTVKPIRSAIGSFEGQLIAGRLDGSGFAPLTEDRYYVGNNLYLAKPDDWRYLSGIVVTYQPKWVPGLFIGFSQSRQNYSKQQKGLGDYLPFFSPFKSVQVTEPLEKRDERRSLFMRWLWPEEQAEFYFEYGRSNFGGTIRENSLRPDASRAYVAGIRKLLPFGTMANSQLLLSVEVTQLQETQSGLIAEGRSWYSSPNVRHGYTHNGQVIGAGIGPGSNMQTIGLAWVNGVKQLGIRFDRIVYNNDLYFYIFSESLDFRRHWTDLSLSANANWNLGNFLFDAKLQFTKTLNYQWNLIQNPGDSYMIKGRDAFNVQFQIGGSYRF